MKVVYIAGPYRATTERQLVEHIRAAEALAIKVWQAGAAPLCPHLNTAHLGGVVPDRVFLDGDLEMLHRCDAVVVTPDWGRSSGAVGEVEAAGEWGIPVFADWKVFLSWLESADRTPNDRGG